MKPALALMLILAVALSGCPAGAPTSKATTPTTTATTATTATGTSLTAGQLSAAGQGVFASNCAGCHGANGQGVTAPAVIGATANLVKYSTAQGLFDYVKTTMPANAPGSLSPQQYLQVTAHILLQNNYVTGNTPLDTSNLGGVPLTRS